MKRFAIVCDYSNKLPDTKFQVYTEEKTDEFIKRFIEAHSVNSKLGYNVKINQLVIFTKNNQSKKISGKAFISEAFQSQNTLEIVVVYPKDQHSIVVELIVNNKHTFKNDASLTYTIGDVLSNIKDENQFINLQNFDILLGRKSKIPNKTEFLKKSFGAILNQFPNKKISIQLKEKQNVSQMSRIKAGEREQVQMPSIPNGIRPSPVPIPPPNAFFEKPQKHELPLESIMHKSNKSISYVPALLENHNQNKQTISLVINFQTSRAVSSITKHVLPSVTMRQILPDIINQISKNGFNWDRTHDDIKESLNILYNNLQFRKLDTKLSTILENNKNVQEFTIVKKQLGG